MNKVLLGKCKNKKSLPKMAARTGSLEEIQRDCWSSQG